MQVWQAIADFDVRSEPSNDARTGRIAQRNKSTRIKMLGVSIDAPEGPWTKIRVYGPVPPIEGFARVAWLEALTFPRTIDLDDFTLQCFQAAASVTSVHYLLALADVESGIQNISSAQSTAFGPFQFLESTWNDYVAAGNAGGYQDIDIIDPLAQPTVAAQVAVSGADALNSALGRTPTYAELYFTHIFGRKGGATILANAHTDPIRTALARVYSDPGRVQLIIDKNGSLLQRQGPNTTVDQVLDEVGARLDRGFARAESLVNSFVPVSPAAKAEGISPPGPLAVAPGDETVPWMSRAKHEIGIQELPGSRSNPQIEKYFRATTLGSQKDDVSWCGAFVSWCLANSGDAHAVAQNLHSARAHDWVNFGRSSPRVYGAVTVLKPLVDGSSGHVGFLTKFDADSVTILAGNQSDSVRERTFSISQVAKDGYRLPA